MNSETYLAVILEEGRDVWEISLPEISAADPKGRERNPTHRFHAVDHSSNILRVVMTDESYM